MYRDTKYPRLFCVVVQYFRGEYKISCDTESMNVRLIRIHEATEATKIML